MENTPPTVCAAYAVNQEWFQPAGEFARFDAEGFDSYGYNAKGVNRAGIHERAYCDGEWVGNDYLFPTCPRVLDEWSTDPKTGATL